MNTDIEALKSKIAYWALWILAFLGIVFIADKIFQLNISVGFGI